MPGGEHRSDLRGRSQECDALALLVSDIRARQGRVLVLRGEAGIGKSALLDHLRHEAGACTIVRAVGVEAEAELAYSGLHQLCSSFLGLLPRLPEPQRDALATVFGLEHGNPPDRLLVSLSALSLLSEAADPRPLLGTIDDAQWLDEASLQVLAFVARRLMAEQVGLVFAIREPNQRRELAGLPEIVIEGVGFDDSVALLETVVPGRLDARVRRRLLEETRGNPLALLELPRALSDAESEGGHVPSGDVTLANQIQRSFEGRIMSLPVPTRELLVLAAAEPIGDPALLWRAAEVLALSPEAIVPAEVAGVIEPGVASRFRHPLARAAAYRTASPNQRRRAHAALAEMTDPATDPDRRAWHRAQATLRPDDEVAAELHRSAERAQARGGVVASAAFLERATELTLDPRKRAERALLAAGAKLDAAAIDDAAALVAAADLSQLDELGQVRAVRIRAQIASANRGNDATPLLLEAAERFVPLHRDLARDTYLDALGAAYFAGRLGEPGLREVALAAQSAPPASDPPRTPDLLLDGLASRYAEGFTAAVPLLRRALREIVEDPTELRWLWLASRVASELWEDEIWDQLADRHVRLARAQGSLAELPLALIYRSGNHIHAGEFSAAQALITEADTIAAATGSTAPLKYSAGLLAAWKGDKDSVVNMFDWGVRNLNDRGEGRSLTWVEYVTALLENGSGGYSAALTAALSAAEHDDLGLVAWPLIELIEAAARCGTPEVAGPTLERLCERTQACGTDWALGTEARCRALLASGAQADALYQEAIDRLSRTRVAVHHARAHLIYGEWLRREGRRTDARHHLRTAHDLLDGFGAQAFAERARRELLATGETARRRASSQTAGGLTPQEAQVARLGAEGRTNQEIGAELFISPKTVEYHLRKVFTKLDITSRRQLRDALGGNDRPDRASVESTGG